MLLLHGFKDADKNFKEQVEGMSSIFPMAMAPGMSMMMSDHIQWAVKDIEAAGAETIVVVPIVATRYNTMMRQWEYIFGMEEESSYASVPRVESKVADPVHRAAGRRPAGVRNPARLRVRDQRKPG